MIYFASTSQLESKAIKLSPFRNAGNTLGVLVGSTVFTMLKGENLLLLNRSLLSLLPLSGSVLQIIFKFEVVFYSIFYAVNDAISQIYHFFPSKHSYGI